MSNEGVPDSLAQNAARISTNSSNLIQLVERLKVNGMEIKERVLAIIAETKTLPRALQEFFVHTSLVAVPEAERVKVLSLLDQRGLIPDRTGKRTVVGLPESQQTILEDPEGLLLQCLRLSKSVQVSGTLLELSREEIQSLAVAGALINSGKALQLARLADMKIVFRNVSEEFRPGDMLEGYNRRETKDYDEVAAAGVSPEAVSLLRENIRHDPSTLQTLKGKLLYYFLHCQKPDDGTLVPVEERVNASILKHPVYGELYRGYALRYTRRSLSLIMEHRKRVAEFEAELAQMLRDKGHVFSNVQDFLNEKLQQS